ncbi:MAG: SUMF1/EgtB/PvdO family nonheme iron enzyme, partial [Ignavibacteriota bacterium]
MQTKNLFKAVVLFCIIMFATSTFANNISLSNFSLASRNLAEHSVMVKFDINWENSWRTSASPYNWDAAWIFVKYRVGTGAWKHAWLSNAGHINPTGSTISTGLLRPDTTYNATTNPGLGVFFYRDADGTGTFTKTGVQLKWNYGANGVADNAIVDFRVFAVEQVYVPFGSYYLGSGSTGGSTYQEVAPFYKYPTVTNPYQVTSEDSISVGASTGKLYYAAGGNNSGDRKGPIRANFPKGYNAFYCMKYEVSQQEYVDFLNSIPTAYAIVHYNGNVGLARYNINVTGEVFSTTTPCVAVNYLSWNDLTSYLDWSGLRPMTELEFEKACRGTAYPVPFECAWGTPYAAGGAYGIIGTLYTLNGEGSVSENIVNNYNATNYVSAPGASSSDSAIYTSSPSASSLYRVVTVTSTAGLAVGMYVKVVAGTGAFAPHTFVSAITDGTHFEMSDYPSTVLSGATICGYPPLTVSSTTGLFPGMVLSVTAGTGTFITGTMVSKIIDATHFYVTDMPLVRLTGGTTVITGYAGGNCAWYMTMYEVNLGGGIAGPVRVGIFAGNPLNTGRLSSGASFYGIMELSGNLAERPVSVDSIGRKFTGLHGDGYLDSLASTNIGCANVPFWPNAITGIGSGFRGGAWRYTNDTQVSDRLMAGNGVNNWGSDNGGRGVRTA